MSNQIQRVDVHSDADVSDDENERYKIAAHEDDTDVEGDGEVEPQVKKEPIYNLREHHVDLMSSDDETDLMTLVAEQRARKAITDSDARNLLSFKLNGGVSRKTCCMCRNSEHHIKFEQCTLCHKYVGNICAIKHTRICQLDLEDIQNKIIKTLVDIKQL